MPNPRPLPDPVRERRRVQLAAEIVGYAAGVAPAQILGAPRGDDGVAGARQLVMYLLSAVFAMSLARIAACVGRDRSTVAHGLRVVEDRRDNEAFDAWVDALEDTVRRAPEAYGRALIVIAQPACAS